MGSCCPSSWTRCKPAPIPLRRRAPTDTELYHARSFQKAQLGPDSVFVDLGSGVGNCVVQAALA